MFTLSLVGLQVIKGLLRSSLTAFTAKHPLVVHREIRSYQLVLAQAQEPLDGVLEGQFLSEVVEQHTSQESELRPALTLIPAEILQDWNDSFQILYDEHLTVVSSQIVILGSSE